MLEKEGSKLSQPPCTVSNEEAKTLLKNTGTQEWQEDKEEYPFKNDSIHMLDRPDQTKLSPKDKPLWPQQTSEEDGNGRICAVPVWIDRTDPSLHPPTCPHFEEARLQVWPTEAPVSEKLRGSGDDLLKTTILVDLTGLSI